MSVVPTTSMATPSGGVTHERIEPSGRRSWRTRIGPRGVGYVPSAQSRSPSMGAIRAFVKPGSSGVTPSTCRESHAVGPLAQP
jgi:hypothetical protein